MKKMKVGDHIAFYIEDLATGRKISPKVIGIAVLCERLGDGAQLIHIKFGDKLFTRILREGSATSPNSTYGYHCDNYIVELI